jgi:nitrate/TMAO reductase-like tetraheme cytochrome c subunit
MEEEQKVIQPTAPPRFRGRLIKVLTLTLFFIILLFTVGFLGLETTSSSQFCASCHEMKPEYYTWKASSHSEVDCVNCHTGSTKEEYAKAKANGLVQVFKKATQTYTAPIRMPNQIEDASCEKCHNISTRDVTPTGDLIIPHDKHKNKGIKCFQCHSGVAHGKIADRKMTYQSDYGEWDDTLGRAAMKDEKFIKPEMETCMKCHEARKVTTKCQACHTTGMFPVTHKNQNFKNGKHGSHARKDLNDCNSCHSFMSTEEVEGFDKISTVRQFLQKDKKSNQTVSVDEYAKQNTFCKDCHSRKPTSHKNHFISNHGTLANQNKEKCIACHDIQNAGRSTVTNVTCASCHPSSHSNKPWRNNHPVQLPPNQKLEQFCYTCHSEPMCSSCHK